MSSLESANGQAEGPKVSVAPTIVAEPASEASLAITIGPAHIVPKKSFVSLRGLPPSVSLSEGHAIGPGSWAIPLAGLPTLKASIPFGISGRAEIVISLIGMDGTLLAEAKTALVVGPAALIPSQEKSIPSMEKVPVEPPPIASRAPELTSQDRARAERLVARGEEYLATGNIVAARDFFERAADAGLAAGALRLATTYDPAELRRLQAQGIVPDRTMARKWYERARELGAPEAVERLTRLGSN